MLVVFLLDKYTTWLDPARELGQETVSYLYRLASVPSNLLVTLSDASRSEEALLNQLDRLERENLVLQASLQQMVALRAENTSLRALLNSAPRDRDDVLAAEIIGVSPNPARQLITINQGRKSQVFTGQPVIDADGLLGQVIEVSESSAFVLLISDAGHSVPVQITRNSVRAVAQGTGDLDRLQIRYLSATTDVQIGDQLVTSGLGGRFPMGYPVARVTAVDYGDSDRFATVWAEPAAQLSQTRQALLLFPAQLSSEGQVPRISDGSPSGD